MKKTIYKITNLINNKSYIGQTTNFHRRVLEHKSKEYNSNKSKNKLLYKKFDEYGIENFEFSILEEEIENYNEREKYWIEYYHTYIGDPLCNGYNMTQGGEQYPVLKGEEHPNSKRSQKKIDEIIDLLKNSEKTFEDISKMYDEPLDFLRKLNVGRIWRKEKIQYPLRKTKSQENLERGLNIIYDLLNTNNSEAKIAKKYGVARSTVTMINIGKSFYSEELIYPLNMNRINSIIEDLKENILTQQEIAKKYEITRQTVRNINLGISYHNKEIIYPIRN